MAHKCQKSADRDTKSDRPQVPRAAEVASRGINSTREVQHVTSALLNDLLQGHVDKGTGGVACRFLGLKLRTADLELKHNEGRPIEFADN